MTQHSRGQWLLSIVAVLISAVALVGQCTLGRQLAERVETRELVVRAANGGPAIEAKAEGTALMLQFVDGEERPLVLQYAGSKYARRSASPSELAITVEDGFAGIVATSGSSRSSLTADGALTGAQLDLSDGNGAATLAASGMTRGMTAWALTPLLHASSTERSLYSSMELTADPDTARLRIASGRGRFEAVGKADGTAGVELSSGDPNDPPRASLVTTPAGSTLTLRDGDNGAPIELSSGDAGKIHLVPGPNGCINLGGERHGC